MSNTPVAQYAADHKFLLEAAAKAAGLTDPVAFTTNHNIYPLLGVSIRGPLVPIDGALVRQWVTGGRKFWPTTQFGIRLYTVNGTPFAHVVATVHSDYDQNAYDLFVCSRADYLKLFRTARKAARETVPAKLPPVLPADQLATLKQNTLGYLDRDNLKRIKELGGRAKRGLLLTGPPGNGKTSACRWMWEECQRQGLEYTLVSPDAYQAARRSCNPVQAVKELFTVVRRGVIFFDDMDIALRDRNTVKETDDQAVFLSALDGMEVHEGVVYVFTTNCSLDLIDAAFKRPGRIDLVLHFHPPQADLRRELIGRWHADIRAAIDAEAAVDQTDGFSFAEVEELKNLLILRYIDTQGWDWDWAMRQFRENRDELATEAGRPVGFGAAAVPSLNGH